MRKIYIILTYTGTLLSKIIKIYTKDEFAHVSIALDKDLNQMYSFGRLNPYNPFFGGFIHENINLGVFKRFKNTTSAIYSLEVNEVHYNKIQSTIDKIQKTKTTYKFNVIGLFAVALKLKIKKDKSFYCAEFVKHVLDSSGLETNLPTVIKPDDFKNIKNLKLEYTGKLRNYKNK